MKSFTFIMNYKGGIYVSQHDAMNLREALVTWAVSLDTKEIKYLAEKSKKQIVDGLEEETPALLRGMKNVWCFSLSIKTGFLIVNVVQTETAADI